MADKEISTLTSAGALTGAELVHIVQSSNSRQTTTQDIADLSSSGIASGTSFPGSPSTNERFFRTDLGLDFYYDGTRWLSVNEYHLSLTAPNSGVTATTVYYSDVPFLGTFGMYLERTEGVFFRSATATWNIALDWRNAAGTATTLDTQSGSGGTNGNWIEYSNDLSAVLDATAKSFGTVFSEVSGTATFIARASLIYRIIAT